jgi:hypothetical protein
MPSRAGLMGIEAAALEKFILGGRPLACQMFLRVPNVIPRRFEIAT